MVSPRKQTSRSRFRRPQAATDRGPFLKPARLNRTYAAYRSSIRSPDAAQDTRLFRGGHSDSRTGDRRHNVDLHDRQRGHAAAAAVFRTGPPDPYLRKERSLRAADVCHLDSEFPILERAIAYFRIHWRDRI